MILDRPPAAPILPEASERSTDDPGPHDYKTLLLGGIFMMLAFYALHALSEIVLPIILAFMLHLLLQPSMRTLSGWHVPKVIAAIVTIIMLCGGIAAVAVTLSGPGAVWIAKVPETIPRLERRLAFLIVPIERLQRTSQQVEDMSKGTVAGIREVTITGPSLGSFLVSGTRDIVVGFLTMIVLLFFLLVSGDLFLRRLVENLPTLSGKKRAVNIANEIESHISGYLFTISLMNAGVGVATGLAAYFCGLSDPALWGTIAFLLNYVLILGPMACVGALLLAGLLTFDTTWQAVLPAALYFGIHIIEGESITPMLLAKRLTLNPVLIIVSLVFWYWMWGIAGALLAVPLLGVFKIICDRVDPLMAVGHLLGTERRIQT